MMRIIIQTQVQHLLLFTSPEVLPPTACYANIELAASDDDDDAIHRPLDLSPSLTSHSMVMLLLLVSNVTRMEGE